MRTRLLLSSLLVLFAVSARASIMVLGNGDRLTGTVLKKKHGKIYFHSDVLGDIVARANAVTIVEPPPSSTPVDSLASLPPHATPANPAAPAVTAAANPSPTTTASTGSVTPVSPTNQPLPGKAGSGPVTAARLANATPVKPAVTPWAGKFELGYDNQLTNVRTVTTSMRAEMSRTVRADDYLIKAKYIYADSAQVPTADAADGEFRLRHNLDSRIFLESDSTAEEDRIQRINFEGEEKSDVGYKLLPGTNNLLDVGVGVVGQYLNADGIEKGWDYLGNVFQDYTYKINGRYSFAEDASAQTSPDRQERFGGAAVAGVPALSGTVADYAYKFHATLQGKLTKHLSLNLHYDYEFNNVVLDPASRGEQRVTTTVGYGF